ncbi:MAG: glycosyltransferase family 4 protein [Acidimicrobiia bacterium]
MKIGLVCPYDLKVHGGVQHQVLELSRLLAASGDEPVVVGPGAGSHGGVDLGDSISIRGNQSVVPISIDPRLQGKLKGALAGVDVLHIHEPLMPVVGWAALTIERPAMVSFHAAKPRWASLLYRFVPSRVWSKRVLTAVSPVAADLPKRFGPVEIIPNGIDTARYRSGVQRHRQQVAFLGRPDPRKGFEVLVEAWQLVSEKVPGAELAVIGIEGTNHNRIRFLGRVDEDQKSRALQASEIFVAPNLSGESFGVVVAEGMAAGCAVVASDLDAFRAVTAGTARLVPPGNAAHLGETLIDLLRSPAATQDMGKRARLRVGDFDWSRVLALYRDGYRRAIETYTPDR